MPSPHQTSAARDPDRRCFRLHIPEVWIRFLIALVGLVLAFAAALFSTVSRESGNLLATLILSAVALLLAVVVGLTTVPYLARRVALESFRDAIDYEVTRVGVFYMVAVVLIAVAALNSGNNLLYIVVACLLGAILVSGLASAIVLNALELDVNLPEHIFAGQPIKGRLLLHNPRKRLPSFSIGVTASRSKKPTQRWRWAQTTFAFPPNRAAEKQWVRLPDRSLRRVEETPELPGIFQGTAYFPFLPARSRQSADLDLRFGRRGRYRDKGFGLSTRFPFAFLTKTRHVALPREVVVYPPVEPSDEFFDVLPLIRGEFESFVRGRGNDLYRIREYLPEDSARHLDWKATAKSGSPMVREFSREDERRLRIVFDNPRVGTVEDQAYENSLALAASLGWHFAGENTQLSFLAQDYKGGEDIYDFLSYLAEIQPGSAPSLLETLPATGDYNIILTSQPRGTIPTALWACSYFVFINGGSGTGELSRDQRSE
jgi:uncharacterized protein (DUF58 family)